MGSKKSSDENEVKTKKPVYPGNSIMVRPNGPLICKGDTEITLLNAAGEVVLKDKEFALCRCGMSKSKPFCDGSHKNREEDIAQAFIDEREEDIHSLDGELTIMVKENAMYSFKGPVTIFSRDGLSKTTRTKGALCRCGHSDKKPFCDVQHKKCGFIG
ncbi:MAG: CDGSH iron-sulfur domain-containing protein [Gammaproteobacteria bacterium]|nr:CDGSH iron-sulfur domain-containing protein [Gammaproteobacteria bacterium]